MNHLKRIFLCTLVLLISAVNFVGVYAEDIHVIQSTDRWRICSTQWTKQHFTLPSNAPNVTATASWAYNFNTGVTRKIATVSNVTLVSLNVHGTLAQVQVNVGIWGNISSTQEKGICTYSDLPIGMEPFSTSIETQEY